MKFLGNTDEVTACDCCGRSDLKSTVALETEAGEVVHYGVVCAARALKMPAKEVKAAAKRADDARFEVEQAARRAAAEARAAEWLAFLERHAPGVKDFGGKQDVFEQIQMLGGFSAARALFKEEGGHD